MNDAPSIFIIILFSSNPNPNPNSTLTAVCTIGTSEVEHVLATQTLVQAKAKNMRVHVEGALQPGVSSKDVVLHIIGVIGTAGGTCVILDAFLPYDFQLMILVLIELFPISHHLIVL